MRVRYYIAKEFARDHFIRNPRSIFLVVFSIWGFLFHSILWAQDPELSSMNIQGEGPIEYIDIDFKSSTIKDLGKPGESTLICGEPVKVSASMEDSTLVLTAPCLEYQASQNVIYATSDVYITDGTLTVQAQTGRFDITKRVAHFKGNAKWSRKTGNKEDVGINKWITVYLGADGIDRIETGPGKVKLSLDKGLFKSSESTSEAPRITPESGDIKRAQSELEQ